MPLLESHTYPLMEKISLAARSPSNLKHAKIAPELIVDFSLCLGLLGGHQLQSCKRGPTSSHASTDGSLGWWKLPLPVGSAGNREFWLFSEPEWPGDMQSVVQAARAMFQRASYKSGDLKRGGARFWCISSARFWL